MLLQWMGDHHKVDNLRKAGDAMEAAVDRVLEDPGSRTRDLGGSMGCKVFGEHVAKAVAEGGRV
jgi:3-isopropylmalate dehydrogenase